MHFSERSNWNTETTDLARAHRKRLESGLPIADLTASNPTRCGFAYPPSLLAALTDPRALVYDPESCGLLPARQAVSAYYADQGVALDPKQIVLTTSTSEAYSFLFRLLSDPGDEVLILQPGYPLFDFLAALDDVRGVLGVLVMIPYFPLGCFPRANALAIRRGNSASTIVSMSCGKVNDQLGHWSVVPGMLGRWGIA